MTRIPLSRPAIGPLEQAYVAEALSSGWLSGHGPFVEQFEASWAGRCNTAEAVAVTSGTAALHLVLLALGAGAGDEVLVPALTYAAVANAVHHTGAVPVVVDVDVETWCISAEAAAAAVTPHTVGIIAVHAYGHPADLEALRRVADGAGVWLVEDAAEAHLATHCGRVVGGLADAGVFSFFGNKIVTTGEGGAVTVNDRAVAEKVRALSRQGVTRGDDRYRPSLAGLGLRLGNLAAAVGCAQVERVDELLCARRRAVAAYQVGLDSIPVLELQPRMEWAQVAPWLCSILLPGGRQRDDLERHLAGRGIETRGLFPSLASLPIARRAGPTPIADHLHTVGLSLPLFADLSPEQVQDVTSTIAEWAR